MKHFWRSSMAVEFLRRPAGLGEPLGRYSHVSIARGRQLVHVAGQVGVIEYGELAGDGGMEAQINQAFTNVATAVAAAGGTPGDIVKTTTLLVGGEEELEIFMRVRGEVFARMFPDGQYPPNTLLFLPRLVEARLLVEVEALAVLSGGEGLDA
jgi:enamine deaminase RidA (YjgF/YER057c/UK114 family)